MLLKLFLKHLSLTNQVKFMQKRGIVIGTRQRGDRQVYLYMVNNLFAEICYKHDNPRNDAESVVIVHGLTRLNRYLEKDLRPVLV